MPAWRCLCNLGSIVPGTLARQVADVVIADLREPAPAVGQRGAGPGRGGAAAGAPAPVAASPTPSAFVGRYYSDEIDATFTVTMKEGRLMVQRETDAAPVALEPSAADQYRLGSMTIRFARGSDNAVDALVVDAGRVRGIRFARRTN